MSTNSVEKQREYNKTRKLQAKAWACIVYPDSAPDGWVDALRDSHVKMLISPLHDKDVTADGKTKKPHWHVMAVFDTKVSENGPKEIFAKAGVTTPPELVKSIVGYARYLCHIDDHDKHRYDVNDVVELSGASWASLADGEDDVKDATLSEIEDWIDENNCTSYRRLCRYARYERPDWVRFIRTNTIHLTQYVKSVDWETA